MNIPLLEQLKDYQGSDSIVSSFEMQRLLRERKESQFKLMSQIPSLDKAIDGFVGGEVISISGPPKHGKTLLAQSLTVNFEAQGSLSLWFTFELPPIEFFKRFPALPHFYLPKILKPSAMDWLEERIWEALAKYSTRVVFIDHLHFLFDLARVKNASLEIGTIIRKLKTLAIDGNFIIFLMCHTSKSATPQKLSFHDIRDSSFVAQESDTVLMIRRMDEVQSKLRVEFHRRTGTMPKFIKLVKIKGFLKEEKIGAN